MKKDSVFTGGLKDLALGAACGIGGAIAVKLTALGIKKVVDFAKKKIEESKKPAEEQKQAA